MGGGWVGGIIFGSFFGDLWGLYFGVFVWFVGLIIILLSQLWTWIRNKK